LKIPLLQTLKHAKRAYERLHHHVVEGKKNGRSIKTLAQKTIRLVFNALRLPSGVPLTKRKLGSSAQHKIKEIYMTARAFNESIFWQQFPFRGASEISVLIDQLSDALKSDTLEKTTTYLLQLEYFITVAKEDIASQDDVWLQLARNNVTEPALKEPRVIPKSSANPETSLRLNHLRESVLERVQDVLKGVEDSIGPGLNIKALDELKTLHAQHLISTLEFKEKSKQYIDALREQSYSFAPLARSSNPELRARCDKWRDAIDKAVSS